MFKELFYWAYTILSKKKRFKGEEEYKAYFLICAMQGLNVLSVFFYINYYHPFFQYLFFKPEEGKYSIRNWVLSGIIFIPIAVYNYFHLYKKRKEIIQHFKEKQMTQFRKDWGVLFLWIYVVLTFVVVFVVGFIFKKTA